MKFLRDTLAVFVRETKPILNDPFTPVFSLGQPLVFLALLGPLVSTMPGAGGAEAWQWFVPGVIVMIALFGTSMTGSNLQWEMQTGSHERVMVTPLSRPAVLVGKSLKEFAPLVAQALLVVAIMAPFGFRVHPVGAVTGLLLLGVLGVGMGALSYALAIASYSREWLFWGVQQTTLFPMLILSGMMMPLDDGPVWMKVVSGFNPLTYVVEAERALFNGRYDDPTIWQGWAAAAVLAALGLAVGITAMRRFKS